MRLSNFGFKDGLEEVVTWGVEPLKQLVEIMNEELLKEEPNTGRLTFIMYELRHKLEDLEETLYRFDRETEEAIPKKKITLADKRRQEERAAIKLEKTVNNSLVNLQTIREGISRRNFATSQGEE